MVLPAKFGRDQRLIASILVICTLAVVVSWAAIRQAEQSLLRTHASAAATLWATFLEKNLAGLEAILAAGLISRADQRVFDFARAAGGVLSYQVIGPDGIVAHSSWSGDYREASADPAALRIIAKGKVLTKVKRSQLADNRETVVVEAYVPIMKAGVYRGAIKVFVDMTAKAAEFRRIGSFAFYGLIILLVVLGSLCSALVWHNMHGRKNAETATDRLRRQNELILNAAGEGVYGIDLEGRTTFVNPAAARMVGWDPDEMLGKPQHELVHHNHPDGTPYPREECPIFGAMNDGQAREVGDEVFWRKDGTSFPVAYNCSPIYDEQRQLTGAVVVFRDITEQIWAERALREAKEQAEVASRSKTEFLANMSHELRTPLNAINGFSEVMSNEVFGPLGDARYREYVKDIHDSGQHLLALINDILDISKVEAGKLELCEEPVDVADVVEAAVRIMRERATARRLRLETAVQSDTPIIIGDRRLLKQIVLNLLSNAVKFSHEGDTIAVRAGPTSTGGAEILVIDNGIGIAAEDIEKVMMPFQQVEGTFSRQHQGTGLGLPLSKRLVELHGGTLEIESEIGAHTTARVLIGPERVLDSRSNAAALSA